MRHPFRRFLCTWKAPLKAPLPGEAGSAEAGYTVAEATVALALLTTVLFPAIAFLAETMVRSSGTDRVVALTVARAALERSVGERAFETATWQAGGGRWQIKRDVERVRGGMATITVTVRRAARDSIALVSLTTQRRAPASTP